jgi:4a-hydroxytetrahydrobiopterin dehydratase
VEAADQVAGPRIPVIFYRVGGEEMSELAAKRCIPCSTGVPPLSEEEQRQLLGELHEGWKVVDGHHLERSFTFPDFREALTFTNNVGDLAESVGHHPDIYLAWGKVSITIFTHKIDGLSEADFVLAAKIDELR